jgi:Mor family transcriptional regulator
MDEKLLDIVSIDDLTEPYDKIARVIGIDATKHLAKEFGGEMLYLPQVETMLQPLRDKLIREEFNGYNYEALARKYGITSRWVRQIVAPIEAAARCKPMDGQIVLDTASG